MSGWFSRGAASGSRRPPRAWRHQVPAAAACLAATLAATLAAPPASAQFDPGDLPAQAPAIPVVSIYDALAAPDRSPKGATREEVAGMRTDQGSGGATCEVRDATVAKIYQRARDAFDQRDAAEAAYWYKVGFASRLDPRDSLALTRLGFMLASDSNPRRDPAAARIVWELAAAAGSRDALFNLGYLFETGVGVPSDPDRAIAWYEKAQAAGNEKAAEAIRRVRSRR